LILRYRGLDGRLAGRSAPAELIDAWTSRAAPLMSRPRSNWRVMLQEPTELREVISVTPAMWVNCFSRGVATEAAITSGLAPGRLALTMMVGKSTSGSAATGRSV